MLTNKANYDAVWTTLAADTNERLHIKLLARKVLLIEQSGCQSNQERHFNRYRIHHSARLLSSVGNSVSEVTESIHLRVASVAHQHDEQPVSLCKSTTKRIIEFGESIILGI